jgi:hypothetical protein
MSCRGLPDNTPLSANLPLPGWTRAGERNGGSTFQHRIPRTALCRWPAAPPPHGAVAASGGSWSSLSPSPRSGSRAVGILSRGKYRRCISGVGGGTGIPRRLIRVLGARKACTRAQNGSGVNRQRDPLLCSALDQPKLGAAFLANVTTVLGAAANPCLRGAVIAHPRQQFEAPLMRGQAVGLKPEQC